MAKTKKWPPTETNPKIKLGTGGSGAKISRNKKGDLVARKDKDYYDTPEMQAIVRKNKLKKGDSTFDGASAPRIGGKQAIIAKSGPLKSAPKKVIRQAKRKPTGSVQARKSQKRLL